MSVMPLGPALQALVAPRLLGTPLGPALQALLAPRLLGHATGAAAGHLAQALLQISASGMPEGGNTPASTHWHDLCWSRHTRTHMHAQAWVYTQAFIVAIVHPIVAAPLHMKPRQWAIGASAPLADVSLCH